MRLRKRASGFLTTWYYWCDRRKQWIGPYWTKAKAEAKAKTP